MAVSWKQALKDYATIHNKPFKIYKKDSDEYIQVKKLQNKVKGSGDEIITSGVGVITSDIVKEVIDDLKGKTKEKKQRKKKT